MPTTKREPLRRQRAYAAYRARVDALLGPTRSGTLRAKAKKLLVEPRRFVRDMLGPEPRRDPATPAANTPSYEQVRRDLDQLLALVRGGPYSHFVVMLSGTTHFQEIRANRPIRITRELVRRGVPVLFSFHRPGPRHHVPPYGFGSLLLESPIDYTLRLLPELAGQDLGRARPLLVVSYPHPGFCKPLARFSSHGWPTLYDVRDDWEEFAEVGQAAWYSQAAERYLTANVDRVMCVSRPLRDKLEGYAPRQPIELSPNALDPGFRAPDYRRAPATPPVVGYFGHLTASWFAWDDLAEVARRLPAFRFEIIGHSAPAELALPANVRLLGPKTHAEISPLAARWSAAIIPFQRTPLAYAADPIKIYEYLALGLPVVSFTMPQIEDYPCTTTAASADEFARALARAVDQRPDPAVLERFLAEHTWSRRVDQLLALADADRGREPAVHTLQRAEPRP